MHRLLAAALIAALGLTTFVARIEAHDGDDHDSHEFIEKVMKVAMKGGLCKKVAAGKATAEEQKKLAKMFQKFAKTKPPRGDSKSWKAKTEALAKAAQAFADGKGSAKDLRKAANCKACHDAHKPKKKK